jgi:hypothetical protein
MDEVHMPPHQFRESVLHAVADESLQQFQIAWCHFCKHIAAARRNPTKIFK